MLVHGAWHGSGAVGGVKPPSWRTSADGLTLEPDDPMPSTYVVCEQDNALPPFAQEAIAQRAGAVHRLASGHSPFLSQPDGLVRILRQILEAA